MKPVHIRFGGYQPPASVRHQAADLLPLVESGALTRCYFSASYLAARVPECALLDLPFMINDRDEAYTILDGAVGQLLADKLQASTGFRVLSFWDNGFRHLTNAVRPIRTPADCAGIRIRTLFSDVHRQVFKLPGFAPVALDVKELIAGVRSGAIEAQENPLTNTYNFGIYLHHRYTTLSGHFFGAAVLLCHQASYAAWSAEVRQAVGEAASEATAVQRRLAAAEDEEVLAKLRLAQNDIIRLTDAERVRFVAAVAPVVEQQRRVFGNQLLGYLES
jgi:TRAP-type transport system periplasmic protein